MIERDAFAASLLEEAKRFLERANEAKATAAEAPNLHAALLLAFSALEAHVNSVADEMAIRPDLSVHAKGALLEREVRLVKGEFVLDTRLKINRLEDRILLLHRIGSKPTPDGAWLSSLRSATILRNQLTHPKDVPVITPAAVVRALEAVIDTIDALYNAVYKKRFPAGQRKLQSTLSF